MFFFFVVTLMLSSSAICQQSQMSNAEIQEMISRSKEVNLNYGIFDQNLIYPGQTLTFLFKDGAEVKISVEKGESQWTIIRDKISGFEVIHGPAVDYPEVKVSKPAVAYPIEPVKETKDLSFLLGMAAMAGLLWLAFVIANIIRAYQKEKRNVDPVTAGTPQVPGGVNDQMAHTRISEIARQRFPGSNFVIKNIHRGTLSGLGKIFYADRKRPKTINLKKVPTYAGEISVNGKEETIYFLQGCGNDARQGNYMSGNSFVFTPDAVINEDGSESPLTEKQETVTDQPKVKETNESIPTVTGSESFQLSMKVLEILEKEISKSEIHGFKIDSNQGKIEVAVTYKNGRNFTKKEEKKETADK